MTNAFDMQQQQIQMQEAMAKKRPRNAKVAQIHIAVMQINLEEWGLLSSATDQEILRAMLNDQVRLFHRAKASMTVDGRSSSTIELITFTIMEEPTDGSQSRQERESESIQERPDHFFDANLCPHGRARGECACSG